jgi:hypothetical protein
MHDSNDKIYEFEGYRLTSDDGVLWNGADKVAVTQKAIEMLTVLLDNPGRVVSREQIRHQRSLDMQGKRAGFASQAVAMALDLLSAVVVYFAVLLVYGGVLWGVLPGQPGVSWEGHLFGALGGAVAAKVVAVSPLKRGNPNFQ